MTEASLVDYIRQKQETHLEQEARASLLQYYSSKCTAHGTNFLTIAIGFLTYVEVARYILPSFNSLLRSVFNSFFISIFVVIAVHQIVRLLVWARLTQIALSIPPSEKLENLCMHVRLEKACQDSFKSKRVTKDKWIVPLNGYRYWISLAIGVTLFLGLTIFQRSLIENPNLLSPLFFSFSSI